MKYKYSIIAGMLSIFLGFIPISIKKPENINYVIYAKTLQQANHIKNELISFYKEKCYAADCFNINKKITHAITSEAITHSFFGSKLAFSKYFLVTYEYTRILSWRNSLPPTIAAPNRIAIPGI